MKPNRMRKIAYHAAIGLLVLMVALLCLVFLIFNPKKSLLYKIADNYKGWAIVRYDDPSCAPLEHENIFLVITIPASGIACTSSLLQDGWRYHRYEYVSEGKLVREIRVSNWGGGGEIWAGFGMPNKHSESFFVGTEQELQRSWASRPK
ncbi:MAG: hypothetical protein ABSF75_16265 [Terracidiphilus sp.]|jgi:uncharacterized protein DUF6843